MELSIKPYNDHIAPISLLPCHFSAYQFNAFPIEHRWIGPTRQCNLCLLSWGRELNASTSTGFRDVKSLLNKHTESIPTGMKLSIHNLQQNTCYSGGTNSVVLLFSVHVCTHVRIHRQNNSDIPTLKKILEVDLGGHAAGPQWFDNKLTPLFILYLDTAITMQFYFTIYETKNNSWLIFITINQLSYEIEYLPLGYFQPRHNFLVIRVLTLPIFGKYTCIIISHQIGSDFSIHCSTHTLVKLFSRSCQPPQYWKIMENRWNENRRHESLCARNAVTGARGVKTCYN